VGITNSFLGWIAANDAAAICTLASAVMGSPRRSIAAECHDDAHDPNPEGSEAKGEFGCQTR
jgi:hypothetical protein